MKFLHPNQPKSLPRAKLTEADLRRIGRIARAAIRSLRYNTAKMRKHDMQQLAQRVNWMYPHKEKV
jgi:hypothetical protein